MMCLPIISRHVYIFLIVVCLPWSFWGCTNTVSYPTQVEMQTPPEAVVLAPLYFSNDALEGEASQPFIEKYDVDVHVHGMYVMVTTEMTIRNPNDRELNGVLKVPLPEDAVVNGVAIDVDNMEIRHQMVDAVVVGEPDEVPAYHGSEDEDFEEEEAEEDSEDADLEEAEEDSDAKDTEVVIPLSPIWPHGYRQVRVQYVMPLHVRESGMAAISLRMVRSELLERKIHIRVDIPGLERPRQIGMGEMAFVQTASGWMVEKEERHITSDADVAVFIPKLPDVVATVERNAKDPNDVFFAIQILPEKIAKSVTERDLSRLRLIWDASGSRQPEDIRQARQVLEQFPETGYYELHVVRNTLESPVIFESRAALLQYIDEIAYDGGTNFKPLQTIADKAFDGMTLLFTDGVDTYKNDLPSFGRHSAAILSGDVYDIHAVLHACGGQAYHTNRQSPEEIVRQLRTPDLRVSTVEGENISDVEGIGRPVTGRFTVMGRLKGESDTVKITLSDGREYVVGLSTKQAIQGQTITSAWAVARIRGLAPFPHKNYNALLELGRKYHIAAPNTRMVVLDSSEDYVEYDIEPSRNLTALYEKYLETRDKWFSVWSDQVIQEWDKRVQWWHHPIPEDLRIVYNCSGQLDKCQELVISHIGIHYMKPFDPPKGWECTEENECNVIRKYNVSYKSVQFTVVTNHPSKEIDTVSRYERMERYVALEHWNGESPYLEQIIALHNRGADGDVLYAEYMRHRSEYNASVMFYLEVGDWFFEHNYKEYAIRILSNLTEIVSYDDYLLRTYAKRLRNAGMLDEAIEIAHVIAERRFWDIMAWYDLASVYAQRGKQNKNTNDIEMALRYYYKTAFDQWGWSAPHRWNRDRESRHHVALMAIEEFNALAAWTRRQEWPSGMPLIPKLDEKFDILLDADLRVLFRGNNLGFGYVTIIEPTTERINYDTTTAIGGMMSRLDKYGSHEYLLKTAPKGEYTLVVDRHMTDTLTIVIYKNWGRPNQSEQLIIYHPDKKWFKIVNEEASESIEDEQENEEALIIEKIQM